MTWEPTDSEVQGYWAGVTAAREVHSTAPLSSSALIRAGLRAAYAKLEDRLFRGEPTILGPSAVLERIAPPLMQYDEADDLDTINELAAAGWRIAHVYGPRDAPRYVLEREQPDPPAEPYTWGGEADPFTSTGTCSMCTPPKTLRLDQVAEHLVVEHGIDLQAIGDAPIVDRTDDPPEPT